MFLLRRHGVSERRACRVVGQIRSTQRYHAVPSDFEARLVKEMREHAASHPTWGYRRVHALLVADGWAVNLKRVERLWRREDLRVPPRRQVRPGGKAPGESGNSAWMRPAVRPGHIWSYDFVALRTDRGAPLRVLNVVDEHTRVAVGCHVASKIGAGGVIAVLRRLFQQHGPPEILRSDNGKEFTAASVVAFLAEAGVQPAFIAPGSPQQNCYVERFNGTMRRELLDGETFHSVLEARVVIGRFLDAYNADRPHRSLGMRTPLAFEQAERARLLKPTSESETQSDGGSG